MYKSTKLFISSGISCLVLASSLHIDFHNQNYITKSPSINSETTDDDLHNCDRCLVKNSKVFSKNPVEDFFSLQKESLNLLTDHYNASKSPSSINCRPPQKGTDPKPL